MADLKGHPLYPLVMSAAFVLALVALALVLLAPPPKAEASPDRFPAFLVQSCQEQGHPVPVLCAAMMQHGWSYARVTPVTSGDGVPASWAH